MNINELMKQVHETAIQKRWWDEPQTFGDLMILVVTEATKAHKHIRDFGEKDVQRIWANSDPKTVFEGVAQPEGVPIELADIIIRTLDIAAHYNIDIETAIKVKMGYNKVRPARHGGKYV